MSAQQFLEGPLAEWVGPALLLVGRCREGGEIRAGLFWLRDARLDIIDLLPGAADTSYAALAQLDETARLLTYDSPHEVDTGNRGPSSICLAKLALELVTLSG